MSDNEETGDVVANGDGGDAAIEASSETETTSEVFKSVIVTDEDHLEQLHDWLREDGTDGDLELLYSSSRDGFSADAFHDNCDDKGATLTVVETTDGHVVGGYTNCPWTRTGGWHYANKAFLFALRGDDLPDPIRLELKDRTEEDDARANFHYAPFGPYFGGGSDLKVHKDMKEVYSHKLGFTYEGSKSWPLARAVKYEVKEVEVIGVSTDSKYVEQTNFERPKGPEAARREERELRKKWNRQLRERQQ